MSGSFFFLSITCRLLEGRRRPAETAGTSEDPPDARESASASALEGFFLPGPPSPPPDLPPAPVVDAEYPGLLQGRSQGVGPPPPLAFSPSFSESSSADGRRPDVNGRVSVMYDPPARGGPKLDVIGADVLRVFPILPSFSHLFRAVLFRRATELCFLLQLPDRVTH